MSGVPLQSTSIRHCYVPGLPWMCATPWWLFSSCSRWYCCRLVMKFDSSFVVFIYFCGKFFVWDSIWFVAWNSLICSCQQKCWCQHKYFAAVIGMHHTMINRVTGVCLHSFSIKRVFITWFWCSCKHRGKLAPRSYFGCVRKKSVIYADSSAPYSIVSWSIVVIIGKVCPLASFWGVFQQNPILRSTRTVVPLTVGKSWLNSTVGSRKNADVSILMASQGF